MLRRASTAVTLVMLFALVTDSALAHPVVDRGRHQAEEGSFLAALRSFDEAEASNDLSAADLVALLEGRAYVFFARGNEAELERAVHMLAAFAPDHELSDIFPPEVHELFARSTEARVGPMQIRVSRYRGAAQRARLVVDVVGEDPGLVRSLRIRARSGDGRWVEGPGTVTISTEGEISLHAEAIGPGGVTIARLGSPDALVDVHGDPIDVVFEEPEDDEDEDEDESLLFGLPTWLWVAGGGVLALVITTTIIATSGPSDDTQVRPAIRW